MSEGIENQVLSQAAGAVVAIDASSVKVTVKGLFDCPDAATVNGVVSVCELPLELVVKFQMTPLGVEATQPVWVVDRALDV